MTFPFADFHFLRPAWLLLLFPAALLIWRLWRATDPRTAWRGVIAAPLISHLMIQRSRTNTFRPTPALAGAWLLGTLALAGPTWRREPAPFAADQGAVVIVLKVSPSMETADVQPTRLTRAVQKINDLVKLRSGAKTALVAYAGSAHRVVPLTTDGEIVNLFTGELAPDVMPREGDAAAEALQTANRILVEGRQPGWILWIADSVAADQLPDLKKMSGISLAPICLLIPQEKGTERSTAMTGAHTLGAEVIPLSVDDADVKRLAAQTHFSQVTDPATTPRWQDAGYYLVPVLALIVLTWFRRGWVLPTLRSAGQDST